MELKPGYKQTEVGVIPDDWIIKQISEFSDLLSSRRIFENDYVSTGIPFYRGTEISLLIDGKDFENKYFITREKYDSIKRQYGAPKRDEILITAVGTLANVYLIGDDKEFYFKDGNLIWLRNINNIDIRYFATQLRNYRQNIINNAIGSSQKALTIVVLKETLIPLPPTKAEQRAIATALSDTEALIQSLEKLIAKKRNIKQGAMQKLLKPKEGWVVKKLGEIGEIITGNTPPTEVKAYWNGNVPWITPTDISLKKDIFYSEREITALGLKVARKVPPNTLLVTCIASIGKNAILKRAGSCNQQINAIIPNSSNNVEFLYYMVENSKQYLLSKAGITATNIISKKDFSEITFSIPLLAEQTRIATILSDMDAEIAALETKLEKYKQVKQGMMQELLTGRTRLV